MKKSVLLATAFGVLTAVAGIAAPPAKAAPAGTALVMGETGRAEPARDTKKDSGKRDGKKKPGDSGNSGGSKTPKR